MDLTAVPFGTTGMNITRVGFGAWAIGGGAWAFGWGEQDDDASVTAIRHAVESGVNWIDTAAVYGLGHSEEIVARALEPYGDADRPYVFTKCGLVWDDNDRRVEPRNTGGPAGIRREVEASLRRLRGERAGQQTGLHRTVDDDAGVVRVAPADLVDGVAVDQRERRLQRVDMAECLGDVELLDVVIGQSYRPYLALRLEV